MKKKHVLFVSYDGMTDSLGQSQVLPYIREISKHEFEYTLISFEKPDRFIKFKETIQSICNESNVNWQPIIYSGSIPIISTIWNVYRLKRKAFEIQQLKPFDLFHSRSHVPSIVAQMLQKKHNVPYLFDMRGFWADERVDGGVWNLRNPIFKYVYNFFKRKEIEFLEESNAIISLTENGKNEILSWQQLPSTPTLLREKKLDIDVIPCCVDTVLFNRYSINKEKQNEIKTYLNISEESYIVGYVGSIGTWYMLPEMFDFFKIFLKNNSKAVFLFVSNEPKEKILKIATDKNIDHKHIKVVSCLHKDVPYYISLFNISIYFIIPAYSKKASSPTKQAELMSMGIPVICNAGVGDSDIIVKKFNAGWVANEFNENEYDRISKEICLNDNIDREKLVIDAKNIFDLEHGSQIFYNSYKRILKI
jgi:glycosyltransferase involved in cell wall biosynthesis